MVKTDEITDSSQILRDILQNKEKQMQENLGNNNCIKELCGGIPKDSCQTADLEKMTMKAMASNYRGDTNDHESVHSLEDLSCDGSEYGSDRNQYIDDIEENEAAYDMKQCDRNSVDGDENKEAKRARVENILSHIRQSSPSPGEPGDHNSQEVRRQKRKQYQPQQHDTKFLDHSNRKYRKLEKRALQDQLLHLQQQLQIVHKKYIELQTEDDFMNGEDEVENDSHLQLKLNVEKPFFNHKHFENDPFQSSNAKGKINGHCEDRSQQLKPFTNEPLQQLDVSNLANTLKSKLTDAVACAVESVVSEIMKEKPKRVESEKPKSNPTPIQPCSPAPIKETQDRIKEEKPREPTPPQPIRASPGGRGPIHDHIGQMARILEKASAFEPPRGLTPDLHRPPPLHSSLPFHLPFSYFPQSHLLHPPSIYSCAPLSESEQTEPLPLVVNTPKKKRTKVTDTRISPKTARALLGQDPMGFAHLHMEQTEQRHPVPSFPGLLPHLPTSVAIPNPSLQNSDILSYYREHPFMDPRSSNHSPMHPDHPSPSCSVSSPSDSIKMFEGSDSFDGHHMHVISFYYINRFCTRHKQGRLNLRTCSEKFSSGHFRWALELFLTNI